MRRALLAAAVTSGFVLARRRPHQAQPEAADQPEVPAQRARTDLEMLIDGDADLVLAEQEAQDTHILQALDTLVDGAS